jgi:hypothetical protein
MVSPLPAGSEAELSSQALAIVFVIDLAKTATHRQSERVGFLSATAQSGVVAVKGFNPPIK